jgi:hypothetical protein
MITDRISSRHFLRHKFRRDDQIDDKALEKARTYSMKSRNPAWINFKILRAKWCRILDGIERQKIPESMEICRSQELQAMKGHSRNVTVGRRRDFRRLKSGENGAPLCTLALLPAHWAATIELSGSAERRFRNNVAGLSMKETKEELCCLREKEIHESPQV